MKKKPKQVKEQDRATIGHGKATSISPTKHGAKGWDLPRKSAI